MSAEESEAAAARDDETASRILALTDGATEDMSTIEPTPVPEEDSGIMLDPPAAPPVDISEVVTLRLKALRELQQNPECQEAKMKLENAQSLVRSFIVLLQMLN